MRRAVHQANILIEAAEAAEAAKRAGKRGDKGEILHYPIVAKQFENKNFDSFSNDF
jgi:hypothetical protein